MLPEVQIAFCRAQDWSDFFFEHQIMTFVHAQSFIDVLCGNIALVGIQAYL